MRKATIAALILLVASLSLASCQPSAIVTTPAPTVSSTASPKASSAWDNTVAAAKQEGKLVISTSNTPPVREAIAKAFKDRFGIEIEYIGGGKGSELAAKLLAERDAGLFNQDIYIGGTTTILTALKPVGAVDSMESMLMLPGVLDKKLWMGGDYLWSDAGHTIMVILAMPNPGESIVVNTNKVKTGEIKVYDDIINPKWKGQIVLNDPTIQGAGQRFVGGVATKVKNWDYMVSLAKLEPMINRDQRLQIESVAKEKYAIGLGIEPNLVTEFLQAGAPIVEILPQDDFTLSAGPNDMAVINKAAHPNAAKVFVNWILDKEGQTVLSKAGGLASIKTDVPTDHLTPQRRLDPSKKYFVIDSEAYIMTEPASMAKAKEIFGPLMK